ncbi:hypothetical protein [Clostridium moutaii]|uniref:hypothetical protein n=1 Tax=Clostridium moutaii TaxID=3240932 RepID=UPI0035108352
MTYTLGYVEFRLLCWKFRDLEEAEVLETDCSKLQKQEKNIKRNISHCNVYVSIALEFRVIAFA